MSYGTRVVASGATSDPYGQRYKGIWICLDLLKTALAGNYVNFGVFELYGDPALKVPASIQGTLDSHCHAHQPHMAVLEFAWSGDLHPLYPYVQGAWCEVGRVQSQG